jgi:hypothetical protein
MQANPEPSSPLVNRRWQPRFFLRALELATLVAASVTGGMFALGIAIAFDGISLADDRLIPVTGVFLLWLGERTKSNLSLIGIAASGFIIRTAWASQEGLLRMLVAIPTCIVFVFVTVQAFRYARGFRNRRLVAQGAPYVLYLRPSMADQGPFFNFEANLVDVVGSIGQPIMLANIRPIRRSGIVRLEWREWQHRIGELIAGAALVIFFVMPRRGYDKPGEDTFWEEFEDDAVPKQMQAGRVVLLFREGWANKGLPLINMNGTVRYGDTSLMTEVHRTVHQYVTVTWPEDLGKARALWFSPGAKPQSLGEFSSSLGQKRRLRAELSPVLDYFGARPKRGMIRIVATLLTMAAAFWFAHKGVSLDLNSLNFVGASAMVLAVILWPIILWVGVKRARYYYNWANHDYENFVLHNKYRRGYRTRR